MTLDHLEMSTSEAARLSRARVSRLESHRILFFRVAALPAADLRFHDAISISMKRKRASAITRRVWREVCAHVYEGDKKLRVNKCA